MLIINVDLATLPEQ